MVEPPRSVLVDLRQSYLSCFSMFTTDLKTSLLIIQQPVFSLHCNKDVNELCSN